MYQEGNTSQTVCSVFNENGQSPFVLACEHASNTIPPEYYNLGLNDEVLLSHAAYDIGALELAKQLSQWLDAVLVFSNVSRLVYDCNRPQSASDVAPVQSERYAIPGNRNLSVEQIALRAERYYLPFKTKLTEVMAKRPAPVLVTIHSFTATYNGVFREVELGVIHGKDQRLADCFLENAGQHTGLIVRRNEPYGPDDNVLHTLDTHGNSPGHPNMMLEIRNDLLRSADDTQRMAGMISMALTSGRNGGCLEDTSIN